MGVNFQKKLLDLQMSFKVMVKGKFENIMTIEYHMKVKKIFFKIYPFFNSKIGYKLKFPSW